MADAKHGLEFLEGGGGMLCDMGAEFRRVEFAPGGARAVEQLLPADSRDPASQALGRDAGLLEIVELMIHAVFRQPGAGALDGVAIGNAIENRLHACTLPCPP